MNDIPPDLMTVREAAEKLRREPRTISRWIRSEYLDVVRIGPARYLRRAQVDSLTRTGPHLDGARPLTAAQMAMVRRVMLDALDALPTEPDSV